MPEEVVGDPYLVEARLLGEGRPARERARRDVVVEPNAEPQLHRAVDMLLACRVRPAATATAAAGRSRRATRARCAGAAASRSAAPRPPTPPRTPTGRRSPRSS